MANCHQQFTDFDSALILTDPRNRGLKKSRKALRDRIREYFRKELPKEIKPKFWSQGSLPMGTAVNPIPIEKTINGKKIILLHYDVDDGVYFIGSEKDRKSVNTYHQWIVDAVKGHTETDPIDKDTCVRTIFSDGHNIDHPIYFEKEGAVPQLAHKAKGWIDSDPREFVKWFEGKASANPQLRRLVRYFKGWCDYQNFSIGNKKMPSGLVMTIWVVENAVYNDRDDVAMKETIAKIKNMTDGQQKLMCNRPTTLKNENLLNDYKHTDFFREKLSAFGISAGQAINEGNQKKACGKWQIHFGDRFSCAYAKDEDENAKKFTSPAVVTSNAKSA